MADKYIDTVETAKIIRKVLKTYFPDIKFSVRSSKYSGGSSIDIGWTDGPTSNQVKKITDYFEGASFDGMIDLKSYVHKVEMDENGNDITVSYGPDFIFENRRFSEKYIQNVASIIINDWGLDPELINRIEKSYNDSYYWDVSRIRPKDWAMSLDTKFYEYAKNIPADKDGNIIKPQLKVSYLKNLAAKAYAADDENMFADELEENYNIDHHHGWKLYQQYKRLILSKPA